jgi:hypothetical protein
MKSSAERLYARRVGVRMICGTDDVRVVPLDSGVYSVHIDTPTGHVRIGHVRCRDAADTWLWQHRDGERSSPVNSSLGTAVHALADYHRSFKTPAAGAPVKRLLFEWREAGERSDIV